MQPTQTPPAGAQPDSQNIERYRKLGLAAMNIVYRKDIASKLVGMLKSEDQVQGLVHAAQTIIGQMQEKMDGPPNAIYAIAPAIVAMIIELAHAAGVVKTDPKALYDSALQAIMQDLQAKSAPPAGQPPQAPPAGQPLLQQGVAA